MHRGIHTAIEQGGFKFLCEQPLAADLRQGFVKHTVAVGHDDLFLAGQARMCGF